MTPPDPKGSGVRPCPFCGDKRAEFNHGWKCYRVDCGSAGPTFSDLDKASDAWNNAYCWKEIDLLRAEVENLKKELATTLVMNSIERDVDALEKLNEKYRAALEKITEGFLDPEGRGK